LLAHAIPTQLNHQLQETGRLLIADVAAEPEARDIERLDIPGEFFELLDPDGHVLQRSRNLPAPIHLKPIDPAARHSTFQVGDIEGEQTVRVAIIPFEQSDQKRFLAVAIPTFGTNRLLDTFGQIVLILFPISLLLTAGISMIYVGRSLAPITELTRHGRFHGPGALRKAMDSGSRCPSPRRMMSWASWRKLSTTYFGEWIPPWASCVSSSPTHRTSCGPPSRFFTEKTELLLSKPRTAEEYQKTLAIFDDELKKLTRMVEGLFTLSMADAGQLCPGVGTCLH